MTIFVVAVACTRSSWRSRLAVVNATRPGFSGMNTAPPSAAASAAFCMREPSSPQCQKSTANPAKARSHEQR